MAHYSTRTKKEVNKMATKKREHSSYERHIKGLAEKRQKEKQETLERLKRIRKLPVPKK